MDEYGEHFAKLTRKAIDRLFRSKANEDMIEAIETMHARLNLLEAKDQEEPQAVAYTAPSVTCSCYRASPPFEGLVYQRNPACLVHGEAPTPVRQQQGGEAVAHVQVCTCKGNYPPGWVLNPHCPVHGTNTVASTQAAEATTTCCCEIHKAFGQERNTFCSGCPVHNPIANPTPATAKESSEPRPCPHYMDMLSWCDGKEVACNCGALGSIAWAESASESSQS